MGFRGQYGLMLTLAIVPAAAETRNKAVPVQAVGNIPGFFDSNAYPGDAIRAREQGHIVASVAIDAHGRATRCDITTSSNSTSLDATTCSIAMTQIHFVAARNASGHNIAGNFELKVDWVLPPYPGTIRTLVTFSNGATGPICSVVIANFTRHIAHESCRAMAVAVKQHQGSLSKPVLADIIDEPGFLLPKGQ